MRHGLSSTVLGMLLVALLATCRTDVKNETPTDPPPPATPTTVTVALADFVAAANTSLTKDGPITLAADEWVSYRLDIPQTGRYAVRVTASGDSTSGVWIEDYINNTDDRTYDITGTMPLRSGGAVGVDGSPLQAGPHDIKVHARGGQLQLEEVTFTLLYPHRDTPDTLVQNMEGSEWKLVWSDEFDGSGLPDSTKWSYNVGNWGWGNNEPQYYTDGRTENARQENGNLIIEAHKNDQGYDWTSARLTTQGKTTFVYGKIEFRAKVPVGRGTWSAGWTLGDAYRDEISWPYCGEIDVLECVGYEIDDATGNGKNHATCHTRAYYFKQGNQIGSEIEVENMNGEFHTYAVEWYPDVIYGFLDGKKYFTYDKNANEREWPVADPQNIILNLAVGGGWGGAQGIDPQWDRHQYILDYVRVYELQ